MRVFLLLTLLAVFSTVQAQTRDRNIRMNLETPISGTTLGNIGTVRGWAFHPTKEVNWVEIYIDDQFMSEVPVGGARVDVYNAYPDALGSRYSGYSQTVNFKEYDEGYHRVAVYAYTFDGNYNFMESEFCVSKLANNNFIKDPDVIKLYEVRRIHLWKDRLVLEGIQVGEDAYNVELTWNTATQDFQISQTTPYTFINEYTEYEGCTEG
jgi:hypothetical protein